MEFMPHAGLPRPVVENQQEGERAKAHLVGSHEKQTNPTARAHSQGKMKRVLGKKKWRLLGAACPSDRAPTRQQLPLSKYETRVHSNQENRTGEPQTLVRADPPPYAQCGKTTPIARRSAIYINFFGVCQATNPAVPLMMMLVVTARCLSPG